ncbi:MAG: preprotein translocase subunit SecE [Deltaproteobacteria bacterium]|nr:preprotein translocase subunit SecE [Deltaproteobacteria bacterium]
MFRLPLLDQWVLAPTDLIAITVGAIFFLVLVRNERAGLFVSEVFTELAKVTWPNRKETAMSSVVVVVLLALSALILFTFDLLWGSLINMMYQ